MALPTRDDNTKVDYDDPAESAAAITPHDSTDLTETTRAIYVGTGGAISVEMVNTGSAIILSNIPDGSIIPMRVTRVNSTGTTASNLVALW